MKRVDGKKLKKQDLYLAVILLAAAAAVFFGYRFLNRRSAEQVAVYVGDQEHKRLALTENAELEIVTEAGKNCLVIQNGQVFMEEADCPDQICVRQNAIKETGETICCMPHRVIVAIESGIQKNE